MQPQGLLGQQHSRPLTGCVGGHVKIGAIRVGATPVPTMSAFQSKALGADHWSYQGAGRQLSPVLTRSVPAPQHGASTSGHNSAAPLSPGANRHSLGLPTSTSSAHLFMAPVSAAASAAVGSSSASALHASSTSAPQHVLNDPTSGTDVLQAAQAAAAEVAAEAQAAVTKASGCPFSKLSNSLGLASPAPASAVDRHAGSTVKTPGPSAFSFESLQDVSYIFTKGLHEAMLHFSNKYGPVCRFANPAALNGASGWLFLNGPEDVAHVCAANVRNYNRRYLPDIYLFVTHGKGILGSQDEYNAKHRRLCGTPFRARQQLSRFSALVAGRAQRMADILLAETASETASASASTSTQHGQSSASSASSVSAGRMEEGFVTDMAVQCQRLALDVVGLVAFSHDFGQTEQAAGDPEGICSGHSVAAAAATVNAAAAAQQQQHSQRASSSPSSQHQHQQASASASASASAGGASTAAAASVSSVDAGWRKDALLWAVNTFGSVLADVFITPLPLLKVMDRLGAPHLKQLGMAVSVMRQAMLQVIHERRAELAAGQPGKEDLLNALLLAADEEGRPLTDEELWEDVHDVMGAGHETTATTTAALIHAISVHPEVEAKVVSELKEVLGNRPPCLEDLERLPYLQACVKECLRLYPAIPVFPREAKAADVLPSGHVVKAGDVVFMSSFSLGRCPRIWDRPLEFDPERFSPEQEARHHRFQWVPFGAGPRMCLGANFAQMSVALMAATLLQRLRFTPLAPADARLIPVTYDITMNFDSTQGLKMAVAPRQ